MLRYVLTQAAQQDLRDIARHTRDNWGAEQARRYGALLEAAFEKIGDGTCVSRTFSELYPMLRVTRCEHHFVFFIAVPDQRPTIIAVLHERMDLLTRLEGRLS